MLDFIWTAFQCILRDYVFNNRLGNNTCIDCDIKLLLADINECQAGSHNCTARAQCVNFEGGFRCSCDTGYMLSDITYANCEGMSIFS